MKFFGWRNKIGELPNVAKNFGMRGLVLSCFLFRVVVLSIAPEDVEDSDTTQWPDNKSIGGNIQGAEETSGRLSSGKLNKNA